MCRSFTTFWANLESLSWNASCSSDGGALAAEGRAVWMDAVRLVIVLDARGGAAEVGAVCTKCIGGDSGHVFSETSGEEQSLLLMLTSAVCTAPLILSSPAHGAGECNHLAISCDKIQCNLRSTAVIQ